MASEAEVKECFEIFDRSSSGTIAKHEVGTAIRALGKCPTNEELAAVLEGCPEQVDLATFQQLYAKPMPTAADQRQPMLDAFKALDKDGTGKIDGSQLRQILATLGDVLSSDEIDNLFKEVSIGNDGLDYTAFVDTLVNSYALADRPPPFSE
mmetsp:Transcript_23984/g.58487  ORF Transcript_23984/g.58487 Transcript_23984/m.58487 type:complete len:152 (+) Transcript_23984:207-662(+)